MSTAISSWLRPVSPIEPVDEPLVRAVEGTAVLLLGGGAAIIAWLSPAGGFLGLWVTLALHLVPGAVIGLQLRMRGSALGLASLFGSVTALILIAMPMAWFGWWYVRPVATILLIATSSLGAVVAVEEVRRVDRRASTEFGRRLRVWAFGPGGLATIGFSLTLVAAKQGLPQPLGAFVAAGPVAWTGLLFIVLAVAWAFAGGGSLGWSALLLGCVVQSLQAMSYRLPTVQVAARHVGLARSIINTGRVAPATDIYQAWSGLFASAAFVKVASGWDDLLLYASVWGAVAAVVMMLAVRAVAGQFHSEEPAWTAALVFSLSASLTTSFFAPQMFGFAGVMVVILLMLRLGKPGENNGLLLRGGILALSIAIAVTHQLSPYLGFLVVTVLTLGRIIKSWMAGVVLLVPAVLFAYLNRGVLGPFISNHDLGRILDNLLPPAQTTTSALGTSLVYKLTFYIPAAALVAVGLASLLVLWRRRTRHTVVLALCAASPTGLFFGSSYGNEGIFRVVLFALPWLAILSAYLPTERGRRFRTLVFYPVRSFTVLVLSLVQVVGCTGMDYTRVVRPTNVAAITWIETTVPDGSFVFSLGANLAEPVYVTGRLMPYISRDVLQTLWGTKPSYPTGSGGSYDPARDLVGLTNVWKVTPAEHVYVMATDSSAAYDEAYGQQLASDQHRLEAELRARPANWQIVYEEPGARVYEYVGAR